MDEQFLTFNIDILLSMFLSTVNVIYRGEVSAVYGGQEYMLHCMLPVSLGLYCKNFIHGVFYSFSLYGTVHKVVVYSNLLTVLVFSPEKK